MSAKFIFSGHCDLCPLNILYLRPLNIPHETLLQVAGGRFLVASNRTARSERPIGETRSHGPPKVPLWPLPRSLKITERATLRGPSWPIGGPSGRVSRKFRGYYLNSKVIRVY